MNQEEYGDLIRLVKDRAGRTFRSAWKYDDEGWDALYVRGDIATEELENTISELIQNAREYEPIVPHDIYSGMGRTEAMIELHEDAILLYFRESETEGVAVTLDKEAGQDLATFVERCIALLRKTR